MSFAPLVGRLDGERPAGGLGGIRQPSVRGSHVGEVVVDDGGLGRPPEDDERLRPAAEGRIVVGVERQGAVEGVEGSRGSPSRSWTPPRAVRGTARSAVIEIASR